MPEAETKQRNLTTNDTHRLAHHQYLKEALDEDRRIRLTRGRVSTERLDDDEAVVNSARASDTREERATGDHVRVTAAAGRLLRESGYEVQSTSVEFRQLYEQLLVASMALHEVVDARIYSNVDEEHRLLKKHSLISEAPPSTEAPSHSFWRQISD